jgi:TRAP-type C4-dicarboxylate transport system substrate-binding protein
VRPKLLEIAHVYAQKVTAEVRRMDTEAMENMKQQGLVTVHGDAPDFAKAAEATWKVVRGRVVPAALFDEVQKLVLEARKK